MAKPQNIEAFMKVIENLISIIKKSEYSIKTISNMSKISNKTIEQWVYNGVKPPVDKAEKVLNALGYKIYISK